MVETLQGLPSFRVFEVGIVVGVEFESGIGVDFGSGAGVELGWGRGRVRRSVVAVALKVIYFRLKRL